MKKAPSQKAELGLNDEILDIDSVCCYKKFPMKKLCLIFILTVSCLCAETQSVSEKFPVDITFLLLDLKYNQQQGAKICEIQKCSISAFKGYYRLFGTTESLAQQFSEVFSQYFTTIWVDILDTPFKNTLLNIGYLPIKNQVQLFKDPLFLEKASLPVHDPYNLEHYHGIVCVRNDALGSLEQFQKNYPGIIMMDATTFIYRDKYQWNLLFSKNETSANAKPRWNLYKKKYQKSLAKSTINDLKCDLFVIKPRAASRGRGIIIVDKNDLDKTLKLILNDTKKLKKNSDPSYNYWLDDYYDSFIVEEFIASDPLAAPHSDTHLYDPTMRLPIILIYNQKKIHIKFLTGYWKFPKKSLSKKGSLNDRHKSSGKYHREVTPTVQAAIKQQLSKAFIPVYQQMLGIDE